MAQRTRSLNTRLLSLASTNRGCQEDLAADWATLKAANPRAYWRISLNRVMNYIGDDMETLAADLLTATGQTVCMRISARLSIPVSDVIMAWDCGYFGASY